MSECEDLLGDIAGDCFDRDAWTEVAKCLSAVKAGREQRTALSSRVLVLRRRALAPRGPAGSGAKGSHKRTSTKTAPKRGGAAREAMAPPLGDDVDGALASACMPLDARCFKDYFNGRWRVHSYACSDSRSFRLYGVRKSFAVCCAWAWGRSVEGPICPRMWVRDAADAA